MPYITVVVPLHNKRAHIARTIDSVLAQDYKDFELIVVDDASTDGGADIVRAYDDPRIRVLVRDRPGPGGYAARNLGIAEADGTWIAFLDADDEWDSFHLSAFLAEQKRHDGLGIYSSAYRKSLGNGRVELSGRVARLGDAGGFQLIDFNGYLDSLVKAEQAVWTSATIVRKSAFAKAGNFPDGKARRGGDTDTWLRLVSVCGAVGWNPRVSVTYHMDADNRVMQTSRNYERFNVITATCDDIIARTTDATTVALLRKVQAQKYYELAMARKRHAGRWFYSLPETRARYFLDHPKNLLCLVPDPLFRALKKISER